MTTDSHEQVLAQGRHLRLVRRDGWEYAVRYTVGGIVAILAITDDDRLILTEQYRPPVRKAVIELPAGLAGDVQGEESETLATAAHRELLEETGYQAQQMVYLAEGPPSAGLSDEIITFFRAIGLQKVGAGGGVDHEKIKVHEVPLAEVNSYLETVAGQGLLIDPKVYTGLYFAK
ncbi:MAG: NUDIX hydrolase [Phycisphaerae bacterium]|nr:NUDIX hydrolase [Phycisphaerae bacterium]